MRRPEYEALYGGAAGGGKSDALIIEALRQVHIPHYRAIIFRKTFPELEDLIDKSASYYPPAFPKARYNKTARKWTFPSGATISFGNMQHEKDVKKYQGRNFDFIGFDELTHFTYDEYIYMVSRNRPKGEGTRKYIRATTNPGGIGHGWVKDRFITPAPAMTTLWDNITYTNPNGEIVTVKRSRIFVPATVFDNKQLLRNDPEYVASLAMLPEKQQKALLYGDWDSFSGQVFMEWRNEPKNYATRLNTHVIEPFEIPSYWKILRGFDWGYSRPFSVAWYALDENKRLYRIREYYGCTGTPNEGAKMTVSDIAIAIKRIEKEDPVLKGKNITGYADPAIFAKSTGKSIAEIFEEEQVYFEKADNSRMAGKMQFHNRLAFNENGLAMFYVFNTCTHFIRTIPNLVYDDKDVEDINTDCEDHIYDECRYVMMAYAITEPKKTIQIARITNPLNQARVYV